MLAHIVKTYISISSGQHSSIIFFWQWLEPLTIYSYAYLTGKYSEQIYIDKTQHCTECFSAGIALGINDG